MSQFFIIAITPPPGSVTALEGQDSVVVPPNGSGVILVKAQVVPAGTVPFTTTGNSGTSTETWSIQTSQAIASTNASNIGLSAYNSAQFTVDANGFVSLAHPSGFPWIDVLTPTQALAVNTGYVTDHTNVIYTLPATAVLGDTIKIVGKLGITMVAQNAGQQIVMSSSTTTVGVGGSITGTNVGDCVELICITAGASTVWRGANFVGNWTIA